MADPHTGFIVAAYAVAIAVILGAIAVVMVDHRAQMRALAKLERRAGGDQAP